MSSTFRLVTLAALLVLLVLDLALVGRRPHVPSLREASAWVALYVSLALVFAGVLAARAGGDVAGTFLAGWATEYSLSVDNLFVFMVIMARFSVPREHQQKVLMVGIIVSLVLRGACIAAGAAAVESFSWAFYVFGAFLVYTAVGLLRSGGEEEEYRDNRAVRAARRVLPLAPEYDGGRLTTSRGGRRRFTPLVVVLLAIGSTDVLFALDSIPAVFGLAKDPFIVFTATIFALMGLRQLYFLLGGLLDRLVYLSKGLAVVLGFIGVKLILEALATNELEWLNRGDPVGWAPVFPTWVSLAVVVGVLAVTTVASLLRTPGHPTATASGSGALTGSGRR